MFKQIIYKVLFAELVDGKPVWNEEEVLTLRIKDGQVTGIETISNRMFVPDDVSVFLRESTTKFDKNGQLLFSGDLVKIGIATSNLDTSTLQGKTQEEINQAVQDAKVVTEMVAPIVWVNGAYCLTIEKPELTVYLTEQATMQMEKVGNVYQHATLIEKPIDEAIFEATKE